MSSTTPETTAQTSTDDADRDARIADLEAQRELLRAENERLREAFADARRANYRRTAVGLGTVGLGAGLASVVFPANAAVLLALAGTGLFGAVLTLLLTPERFIPAELGERVAAAGDANARAIVDELGLSDRRLYLPTDAATDPARLFVPQRSSGTPPTEARETFFVVEDDERRGVSLHATGATLLAEFDAARSEPLGSAPGALATQLSDAVVELFELARSVDLDLDAADGRLTLTADEPLYGDATRFDHPLVSFVGVGLAVGLDRPVELVDARAAPLTVTYRWEPRDQPGGRN
ncbi:hypothetical protein ACNS7O_03220 [Haloferacaceae archaeon DSL9]